MTRNWQDVKAEKVDHDALVSRVAEVLGAHRVRAEFWHDVFTCDGCDWRTDRAAPEEVAQRHRAHLATVLAELIASERAAAAVEALEGGASHGDHHAQCASVAEGQRNGLCDCRLWMGIDSIVASKQVDARVADAWDEGRNAGVGDMAVIVGWGVQGAPPEHEPNSTPNPYRSTNTTPTKENS